MVSDGFRLQSWSKIHRREEHHVPATQHWGIDLGSFGMMIAHRSSAAASSEYKERAGASADAPVAARRQGIVARAGIGQSGPSRMDGFGPGRFGRSATPQPELSLTRFIILGARLRVTRVTSAPRRARRRRPAHPLHRVRDWRRAPPMAPLVAGAANE